jgi:multidrug efflux pump subunit AcrB
VALWGDLNERVAKETAEQIKDELQALPEVSQVSIGGVRDYEIAIELSEEKMRTWGLTFDQISRALSSGSVNLSGGTLRTKGEEVDIKAVGRKYTGEEFAKIVVLAKPTGEIITLGQIATIRDAFTEDAVIARFNGKPAAMIGVFKTDMEDAITVAKATRKYVEQKAATLPDGVHLTAWNDFSTTIESQIDILVSNGLQGLALVILVMWLFLGTQLSLWVSVGIPVAVSGGLVAIYFTGGSLNIMSLLGPAWPRPSTACGKLASRFSRA